MALILGGCASAGNKVLKNEDAKSVAAKIEKGKTTKADVRRMFGDPMTTSYTDSGNEIWKYEFTKTHSKVVNFIPVVNLFKSGAEGKKKELVVFFDQNGVVKNYSMSTSDVDLDTSLFQ
jgi:outer membrane protein assembly factor BamE (lipoprotein component of BamABCDE complex)